MLRRLMPLLFVTSLLLAASACSSAESGKNDGDPDIPDYPGSAVDGDADETLQDGDTPDGDIVDGDGPSDGDLPDGDLPDGDPTDGDDPDGDVDPDDSGDGDLEDSDDPDGDLPRVVYRSSGTPYEPGDLDVTQISIAKGDDGAPADLLIFTPTEVDDYAVVVFQHGFLMANRWYSTILRFIASHGFVVVAPQMYAANGIPLGKPGTWDEAQTAAQVYAWLDDNLSTVSGVRARLQRLGLSGHSRGGKVIWIVLDGDSSRAIAVAGVDPVDGTGGPLGGEARVVDGPFDFPFPTLVIGTGYGPNGLQACAPAGDNHVQFYGASAPTAFHHVALNFGHNDMLDDNPDGCGLVCTVCEGGESPTVMRTYTAGILSAFFRWTLQDDLAMLDYLNDADSAPVALTVERK